MKKKCVCDVYNKQPVPNCPVHKYLHPSNWEKEFEDEMVVFKDKIEPDFENHSLLALLEKSLLWDTSKLNKFLRSTINVRVRYKDGCIQIERVK